MLFKVVISLAIFIGSQAVPVKYGEGGLKPGINELAVLQKEAVTRSKMSDPRDHHVQTAFMAKKNAAASKQFQEHMNELLAAQTGNLHSGAKSTAEIEHGSAKTAYDTLKENCDKCKEGEEDYVAKLQTQISAHDTASQAFEALVQAQQALTDSTTPSPSTDPATARTNAKNALSDALGSQCSLATTHIDSAGQAKQTVDVIAAKAADWKAVDDAAGVVVTKQGEYDGKKSLADTADSDVITAKATRDTKCAGMEGFASSYTPAPTSAPTLARPEAPLTTSLLTYKSGKVVGTDRSPFKFVSNSEIIGPVSTSTEALAVFNTDSMEIIRQRTNACPSGRRVHQVQIFPNGNVLLGCNDWMLRVLDYSSLNELRASSATLNSAFATDNSVAISPDGSKIVAALGANGGRIYLVDAATLNVQAISPLTGQFNTASFSPDGTKVVVAHRGYGDPNCVSLLSASTLEVIQSDDGQNCMYQDGGGGMYFASYVADGNILVHKQWSHFAVVDPLTFNVLRQSDTTSPCFNVAVSPDGFKVSCANRGGLRIYHYDSLKLWYNSQDTNQWLYNTAWSPDSTMVSGGNGGQVGTCSSDGRNCDTVIYSLV